MKGWYQCPSCDSSNVWWDYTIDAREHANGGNIEQCDTGGDRGQAMTCWNCGHETDNGEEWKR